MKSTLNLIFVGLILGCDPAAPTSIPVVQDEISDPEIDPSLEDPYNLENHPLHLILDGQGLAPTYFEHPLPPPGDNRPK